MNFLGREPRSLDNDSKVAKSPFKVGKETSLETESTKPPRQIVIAFLRNHRSIGLADPASIVDEAGHIILAPDEQVKFLGHFRDFYRKLDMLKHLDSLCNFEPTLIQDFIKDVTIDGSANTKAAFALTRPLLRDRKNIEVLSRNMSDKQAFLYMLGNLNVDVIGQDIKALSLEEAENYLYLLASSPEYGRLLEASKGKEFIKALFKNNPSLANVLNQLDLSEKSIENYIPLLLEKDIFDFSKDEAEDISNSILLRSYSEKLLDRLPQERQQVLLPYFISHYLDIDFGDLEKAKALISRIQDAQVRESLLEGIPKSLEETRRTPEKIREKFRLASKENASRIYEELSYTHGDDVVNKLIGDIQKNAFYSININLQSIIRVLERGRVASNWIGTGRYQDNISSMFKLKQAKDETEKFLGIRGKGTKKDPHPIYAAMGYANGREEITGAAAFAQYGKCYIKLKPDFVRETAIFVLGDSMTANLQDPKQGEKLVAKVLDIEGSAIGKAKLELDPNEKKKYGYVETILTQGLTVDDIDEIVIPDSELATREASVEQLKQLKPNIKYTVIANQ